MVPIKVEGLSNIIDISAGIMNSLALTSAGGVKAWGFNGQGQLGDGTTVNKLSPINVIGLTSGVIKISAGPMHSLALTSVGGVKAWGYNAWGNLGTGNTNSQYSPVDVSGLTSGVIDISAGDYHSLALTSAGGVKAWGYNASGQLGNNSTANVFTPINVTGLTSGVTKISAGSVYSLALTSAGGVKAWGANWYGHIGDNSTIDRLTPVNVNGLTSGVIDISAGDYHSLALTSAGGVKAWGYNGSGQLGDGTTVNKLSPINVSGLISGIDKIFTGSNNSFILTNQKTLKAWGYNASGQLGDGTTIDVLTPTNISIP